MVDGFIVQNQPQTMQDDLMRLKNGQPFDDGGFSSTSFVPTPSSISGNTPITTSASTTQPSSFSKQSFGNEKNTPVFSHGSFDRSVQGVSPINHSSSLSSSTVFEHTSPQQFSSVNSRAIDTVPPVSWEDPQARGGGVLWIMVVLFVVMLGGVGGYYFWLLGGVKTETTLTTTSNLSVSQPASSDENTDENKKIESQSPLVVPPEIVAPPGMGLVKVNIAIPSSVDITAQIRTQLQQVTQVGQVKEIAVLDTTGAPVDIATFFQIWGISLSQQVMNQLGNDFSLFAYNDNGSGRLGFSVSVRDAKMLSDALRQEEPQLAVEMSPLYLGAVSTFESLIYSNSSYRGASIRFINHKNVINYSFDYTVFSGRFYVGMSKQTIRAIIDKELSEM